MSGLFHRDPRRWWGIALGLSVLGHVAGAAVALDIIPAWPKSGAPQGLAEITVTSLILPDDDPDALIAPGMPEASMTPDGSEESATIESEPAPQPPSDAPPELPDDLGAPAAPDLPAAPDVTENPLLPEAGEAPGMASLAPGAGGLKPPGLDLPGGTDDLPGTDQSPGPAPGLPAPPRFIPPPPPNAEALRAMVTRIRDQMDLPCTLVLPRISEGDTRLLVAGGDDLSIRAAADRVLAAPAPEMPVQAVLLDRRQCPAVNFLRSRGEYPAFGLSIGLVNPGILSGGRLIGRIDGIPEGAQTTLLLVDDNGVVQDLRRFLRFGGGVAEFDVPVTRDGAMRDTSQLLIAAVTPDLLNAVTNLGGREAGEFFPALDAEIGQTGALAVIPFDLR